MRAVSGRALERKHVGGRVVVMGHPVRRVSSALPGRCRAYSEATHKRLGSEGVEWRREGTAGLLSTKEGCMRVGR